MTKRVTDLTAEELELLAGEAWSSAAREALANGLSVTGSRDGRRYRYYPDGRIEDLGPVAAVPATLIEANVESPSYESVRSSAPIVKATKPATGVFEMPTFEMPKLDMPKIEIPKVEMAAALREFAERSAVFRLQHAQAKDTYERTLAAAEAAAKVLESTYSTATLQVIELTVIEMALANTNAAFDFASELITAKTLSEVIELSNAHARKQFETLTQQGKELGALAQKVATETAEPIKLGLAKSRKSVT